MILATHQILLPSGGTVAAADITDSTATGRSVLTAASAAAARSAIDAPEDSLTLDPMAGTGWTTLAGSGTHTETWSGGELACTIDGTGAGSGAVRHATLLPSPLSWSIAIRVDVETGDGGAQRQVYVAAGVDANNNIACALFGDGTVVASATIGGGYAALASVAGPDAGQRTGGQLWLLLSKDAGTLAYAWGVGSGGARPTSWTVIHVSTTAAQISAASGVLAQVGTVTDTGIAWAVDVRAIHYGRAGVL